MTELYVPTKAERELVKQFALKQAKRDGLRTRGVHIEVGSRFNTEDDDRPISINLRIVTDNENWDDTDLHDLLGWSHFTDGFELSSKGEAEIDFYLYEKLFGTFGELVTNMQAVFDHTGLIRIEAGADGVIWERAGV